MRTDIGAVDHLSIVSTPSQLGGGSSGAKSKGKVKGKGKGKSKGGAKAEAGNSSGAHANCGSSDDHFGDGGDIGGDGSLRAPAYGLFVVGQWVTYRQHPLLLLPPEYLAVEPAVYDNTIYLVAPDGGGVKLVIDPDKIDERVLCTAAPPPFELFSDVTGSGGEGRSLVKLSV